MPDTKHVYPTQTHTEDLGHACRVLIYVYIGVRSKVRLNESTCTSVAAYL